ncbi:MAG: hypothetical protein JNK58_05780 [Phycisphaerae bacterium]|nr:hypothetical protein [Phycisphaerae bacterium]
MAASAVMFVGTLLALPAIIVRIPDDYFAHEHRPASRWAHHHPLLRVLFHAGKNILGIVFIVAGTAMLILPGQGLLSLLIGFFMLDFPAKYRVERWLVRRKRLLASINWLRKKAGHGPIRVT